MDTIEVTRYALLKAKIRELEKEANSLGTTLKEELSKGVECPHDGPYIVVLERGGSSPSYKTILEKVLDDFVTPAKRPKAEKFIQEEIASVPASERLAVKVNSDYCQ